MICIVPVPVTTEEKEPGSIPLEEPLEILCGRLHFFTHPITSAERARDVLDLVLYAFEEWQICRDAAQDEHIARGVRRVAMEAGHEVRFVAGSHSETAAAMEQPRSMTISSTTPRVTDGPRLDVKRGRDGRC